MAYGITIEGVDGIYQVDSTTTSTRFLAITHTGSVTSAGGDGLFHLPSNKWDTGDILLAKPNVVTSTSFFSNFRDPTDIEFNVAFKYIVLKPTNSTNALTNLNGSSYGIEIKNSAGSPIKIFDSRSFASGIDVKTVVPHASKYGGDQPYTFGGGNSVDDQAAKTIYTSSASDWPNVYVSVNSGIFLNPSSVTGEVLNGYYYYQTGSTYKILHQAYIKTNSFLGTITPTNGTAIMVACLKA